jgi:hypothetical protein
MPTKSLLLVFIHGFKGGDHTFDGKQLPAAASRQLVTQ